MTEPFVRLVPKLAEQAAQAVIPYTSDVGSVSTVDAATLRCTVTIDGSGVPMECILAAHTMLAQVNDRVGIQLFGSQWVVMVILNTARGLGEMAVTDLAIADTYAGGSFASIAGVSTGTITRYRSTTRIVCGLSCTWFSTAINTGAEFALRFSQGGFSFTKTLAREQKTPASSRSGATSGWGEIASSSLSGVTGAITVTLQWRLFTGGGTLSVDSNDGASFWAKETI